MRKTATFFLLVFSLSACVTDDKLVTVEPYYLFHDNSSKVWLINHCYQDGKDFAPVSNKYKEIITFYESANCYIQPMNTFGDERGRKGSFTVGMEKKQFMIDYPDDEEDLYFKIKMLSERKIILEPDGGSFPYTLELIPVPEP